MLKIKSVFFALPITILLVPALGVAETSAYDSFDKSITLDKPTDEINAATKKSDEWLINVGLGFGYGSIYNGAAQQKFFPLPIIDASKGNWNIGLLSGIQYSFINEDNLQAGAGLSYDFGRRETDLPKRYKGLGDVDGGAQGNLFVNYQPIEFIDLSLNIIKSQGDAKSLLVTAGIGTMFPIYKESLSGLANINVTWANEDHMNAYYGVNNNQAARSKFKKYKPNAGIESIDYSIGINYEINKKWSYNALVGVNVYQSEVKDSPIVEDAKQPYFFNSLNYSF